MIDSCDKDRDRVRQAYGQDNDNAFRDSAGGSEDASSIFYV